MKKNNHFTLEQLRASKCFGINPHLQGLEQSKPAKYHNQKIQIDSITFDSKKESRRYVQLAMMQKQGLISHLQVHRPFKLSVCTYIADFCYTDHAGRDFVEDVKSPVTRTAAYKLKKKLMWKELNIQITEI